MRFRLGVDWGVLHGIGILRMVLLRATQIHGPDNLQVLLWSCRTCKSSPKCTIDIHRPLHHPGIHIDTDMRIHVIDVDIR